MNTRRTLHELVDHMAEEDLITAVRVLRGLELAPDPLTVLLENAPIDDEPFDPSELDEIAGTEPSITNYEVVRCVLK